MAKKGGGNTIAKANIKAVFNAFTVLSP